MIEESIAQTGTDIVILLHKPDICKVSLALITYLQAVYDECFKLSNKDQCR